MNALRIRYARLADLPLDGDAIAHWLSADERAVHAAMRSSERRATWLAGRILAKRLVLEFAAAAGDKLAVCQPSELHIESRSTNPGHGERPTLFVAGVARECAISIAHSQRGVLAAVTLDGSLSLGVDLAEATAGKQAIQWTFTPAERAWLAGDAATNDRAVQIWALKEALYKACQQGEGFSPRQICVAPGEMPSYPKSDLGQNLQGLQSWRVDGHRAALAVVKAHAAAATIMEVPLALSRAA